MSRILILGGGFAGMFAARQLERRIGWSTDVELINDANYFVFQPLLPEVAAGGIASRDAVSPLRQLLPGVKVRQAHVYQVDTVKKIVTIFQGQQRRYTELGYDHLVIALGQISNLSHVPGLAEHALPMKTLADALALRNHIIEKLEHADITEMEDVKAQLLTFTVVGAGFSGIETAGEIKDLIDRSVQYYPNIDRSKIRVIVLEFGDRILPELPENLAAYAHKKLSKRGIEVLLNTGVSEATATHIVTSSDQVIGTRTIIATIGNSSTKVVQGMDLPQQNGRICVQRCLKVEGHTHVWSIGDAALIPMNDTPMDRTDFAPPTAQFAVREAQQLARNIELVLAGKPALPFAYKSKGALASLGSSRGVVEVFGLRFTGFPAWVLWRSYYLSFVPGFGTKLRILINWVLDALISRSTVQIKSNAQPAARYIRYRAGDRVFEHGNRADGFYMVLEGTFELIIHDQNNAAETRRTISSGGHFGERVLLGENLRTGSVRALEDSRVLVLDATDFQKLTKAMPALNSIFDSAVEKGQLKVPSPAADSSHV